MRNCWVAAAACLAVLLGTRVARAQAIALPKPGPEVQQLGYFVGQWKVESEWKKSVFGPAAKTSGTETCEWFAGGFHVVCHLSSTSPFGDVGGMTVLAYDRETNEYTIYGIDSTGPSELLRGSVSRSTWIFNWAGTLAGKPVRMRSTISTSINLFTTRIEAALGDGPLAVIEEVRHMRVK